MHVNVQMHSIFQSSHQYQKFTLDAYYMYIVYTCIHLSFSSCMLLCQLMMCHDLTDYHITTSAVVTMHWTSTMSTTIYEY